MSHFCASRMVFRCILFGSYPCWRSCHTREPGSHQSCHSRSTRKRWPKQPRIVDAPLLSDPCHSHEKRAKRIFPLERSKRLDGETTVNEVSSYRERIRSLGGIKVLTSPTSSLIAWEHQDPTRAKSFPSVSSDASNESCNEQNTPPICQQPDTHIDSIAYGWTRTRCAVSRHDGRVVSTAHA